MKTLALLFLIGTPGLLHAAETLKELVARIDSTASAETGMDQAEQKLASDLSAYKTEAADLLVPLLKSQSEAVRQLAGYCLLELPKGSLLQRHLPELIAACTEERGWLPNAIADIDDEEAVVFLAKDFRRSPQIQAQIDNALVRTAPRSIAPLLAEFGKTAANETDFLDKLAELWTEMGETAAPAVPLLLTTALDPANPTYRRLAAIRYLGAIGPSAESSFPKLKKLAEGEPATFAEAVEKAIASSRTEEAAMILLPQAVAAARHDGELYLFRDLADLGKNAAPAGDQLVRLLEDPDPQVRLGACRTLGYTTRLDLWPFLAKALNDSDWRVAFAACSSLSQLKAKDAEAALAKLAKNHWYPRVRHAALSARFRIRGEQPPEENSLHVGWIDDFFFDFSSSDTLLAPMAETELDMIPEPGKQEPIPLIPQNDEISFMSLHPKLCQSIVASFSAPHCRFVGMIEKDKTHFVALTAGEWVGGLLAVPQDGKATRILEENIAALIDWNGRLMTLSGSFLVSEGEGAVHEVAFEDGAWKTHFLYALPGCPISGGISSDGRLVANCQGGAVAIDKDGRFEYLGSGKATADE